MSCPLFSTDVHGVWTKVVNETFNPSGVSRGIIYVQPISRNTLMFAPKDMTLVSSSKSVNFTDMTFDDGVTIRFLNPTTFIEPHEKGYQYSEGEFIASLQLGNSFNDAFFASPGRIYEAETGTSAQLIVNTSSWDAALSKFQFWVGEEIYNLASKGPSEKYVETRGSCTLKCIVMYDLDNAKGDSPTYYAFGHQGDTIPHQTVQDKDSFTFVGWFEDRELTIPFNDMFKDIGLLFVWGRWKQISGESYVVRVKYDRNVKPYSGAVEHEYSELTNSNPFYTSTGGEEGVGIPFYTGFNEHPDFNLPELFSDVATVIGRDDRFPIGFPACAYNPFIKPRNIIIEQTTEGTKKVATYNFTPRCVYTGDSEAGKRLGVFICPFGARIATSGNKLEDPFYTFEIEHLEQSDKYSLDNGVFSYTHVANLEPYIGVPWLYIYNYPKDEDIPTPDKDWNPPKKVHGDIIPILTMMSSRITAKPSINMYGRYIN